ncbi:MAG: SAM-dependent methyltransferase, partial [Moorea sp. SIO4G2]|nr:SAM-dependent methyltransferase [Moorena sp. SIO4G2]
PSKSLFDYDYQLVKLSDEEFKFLEACDQNGNSADNSSQSQTVAEIIKHVNFDLDGVRSLLQRQLIMLKIDS